MIFSVTMKRVLEQKMKRLVALPQTFEASIFWSDMAQVLTTLSETPIERGEILYGHKQVKLNDYAAVFGPIATQYAVNEETHAVFVTRLTISGNHQYPPEFEEILNQEPF